MKKLYIIRGAPGSGKTTRAKSLNFPYHYEADMYFMQDGEYKFDRTKIASAHAWCKSMVEDAMTTGSDVVVSNTFVKKWEYAVYEELAKKYSYTVTVEIMTGNYENVHEVPSEIVQRMKQNFEY